MRNVILFLKSVKNCQKNTTCRKWLNFKIGLVFSIANLLAMDYNQPHWLTYFIYVCRPIVFSSDQQTFVWNHPIQTRSSRCPYEIWRHKVTFSFSQHLHQDFTQYATSHSYSCLNRRHSSIDRLPVSRSSRLNRMPRNSFWSRCSSLYIRWEWEFVSPRSGLKPPKGAIRLCCVSPSVCP